MKRCRAMIRLTLLLIFMFSLTALAQQTPDPGAPLITPPPIAEEYRWLYELLMKPEDRAQKPNESFKSFWVHLNDSDSYFPNPDLIKAENIRPLEHYTGTMRYVVIKKHYNYDVVLNHDGSLMFNVRILLKDPQGSDLESFREKVQAAEDIWNSHRAPMDFKYFFKFEVVEDPQMALYSVNVLDSTRGPYDVNWGRDWNNQTVAHEIGHMMGLGDEYQTFTSISDCLDESLMCSSWTGAPMPHHYYFILRRLLPTPAQP